MQTKADNILHGIMFAAVTLMLAAGLATIHFPAW